MEETKIGMKLEAETKDIAEICEKLVKVVGYELEKGIELRKQMTADISHELRTPLTVLANKLEVPKLLANSSSEKCKIF